MAKKIGSLEADLGLDDAQFQAALGRARAGMKRTSGSAQALAQSIGLAFGTAGIVLGITTLAKKIFTLGVAQEQINTSFGVFLGSVEKANVLIEDLEKFAAITPFTSTDIFQGAKALLAFGFAGDEIMPTIKTLGEISAGTGKNLGELSVIFGQIKSAGRLMGQDLLQLINAGFNPLQNISERTGISMAVLKKEMEKGAISFDMVKEAFVSATSEGGLFFNMMEKQSKTVGGRLSTLQDNIELISKALFEGNAGPLNDFINNLAKITSNVDAISTAIQNWLALATIIPRTVLKIATSMDDVNESIKDGSVSLMGFKGIPVGDIIKEAEEAQKEWNDTLDETKRKFLELTVPQIERLDTIAKLEGKISGLKEEIRNATAIENILLGQQLSFYEKQKEELEGMLKLEENRLALQGLQRTQKGAGALREEIVPKSSGDIMADFGMTDVINSATLALQMQNTTLQTNSNAWAIWLSGVQSRAELAAEALKSHQENTAKLAEISQTVGTQLGEVFSAIAISQENLVQAMAGATSQIIQMYLRQSIAAMIAAAMADPSMPFPFGKIAIAAAGIVAVGALFSKIGGSGSGVSAGSAGAPPGVLPSQMKVSGEISGYNIALNQRKEGYRRSRMG